MEFILTNIKSNQTKRLEFLKNFDKIQNKAKKFDMPEKNELYTKETLNKYLPTELFPLIFRYIPRGCILYENS